MRLHLDNSGAPGGISQPGTAPTGGVQQDARTNGKGGVNSAGGFRDSVGLSGPSAALNRLAVGRAARVQQLSAAVKSGSYQVSSAAISGALVGHSLG